MELETDQAAKVGPAPALSSVDGALSAAVASRRLARRADDAATARFTANSRSSTDAHDARYRGARLAAAHTGDHGLIYALLRAANQSPTHHDFVSWLDEPSYSISDRLLVKEGERVVAHLQVLNRAALFENVRVPVGIVQDLAVLPELLPLGYDRLLLDAAERAMRESHAAMSFARTPRPEPFLAAEWSETATRGYSQCNVGDLLAHLTAQAPAGSRPSRGLRIRLWRHIELDAVRAVYRATSAEHWGALCRSEQYWHWLVGRRAHSDLIVAVDGPDAWEDLSTESRIVGYAVTHGPQVLELCGLKEYGRAAPRLLERACQDAIERDYHTISLHTPADDPLHELVVTAGGSWCSDERGAGGTLLVKLLDPERWIGALDPVLRARTRAAGIARPCELGFDVEGARYRLILTRRRSRLVGDDAGAVDVWCTARAFSNLLVGNLSADAAGENGQLEVTGENTPRLLSALFPPSLFWQSPFDTLRM